MTASHNLLHSYLYFFVYKYIYTRWGLLDRTGKALARKLWGGSWKSRGQAQGAQRRTAEKAAGFFFSFCLSIAASDTRRKNESHRSSEKQRKIKPKSSENRSRSVREHPGAILKPGSRTRDAVGTHLGRQIDRLGRQVGRLGRQVGRLRRPQASQHRPGTLRRRTRDAHVGRSPRPPPTKTSAHRFSSVFGLLRAASDRAPMCVLHRKN